MQYTFENYIRAQKTVTEVTMIFIVRRQDIKIKIDIIMLEWDINVVKRTIIISHSYLSRMHSATLANM